MKTLPRVIGLTLSSLLLFATLVVAADEMTATNDIDSISTHLDEMGTDPANPVPPEPAAMTKKTGKK